MRDADGAIAREMVPLEGTKHCNQVIVLLLFIVVIQIVSPRFSQCGFACSHQRLTCWVSTFDRS